MHGFQTVLADCEFILAKQTLPVKAAFTVRDRRQRDKRQFFIATCLFYCLAIKQKHAAPSTFTYIIIFVARRLSCICKCTLRL